MPIYRIADLNIKITPETKFSINRLAPYMVDADKYDFQVTVSQQDIDYELSVAQEGGEISAEFIAVFRQICTAVLQSYNGMFIHSAAIKYEKKAYLFTAPSGTGKTTHIKLWKSLLKDRVQIINGDKPLLREKDGVITVYGNPWNGKEEYGRNISAPLGGIFILKRSTENRTAVVPPFEALKGLLAQTMRPTDKESAARLIDFLNKIVNTIPVYTLECTISDKAVQAALAEIESIGKCC